ncbi:BsuPI-related putative proteinase inhibitor [Natrarchaeobius chitinivorans]|uniref:Intracellular proteinase inhibitor BsuPI domain-containing protein n=1 Tax=Natrarchaeobius chitinivorans TaxID=1679083 RepID=A0A3N6M8L8_NATCH|nr:BsuPI-related putative proteinase inhibitor [Natrarchaeobius chitinivorans]RQG92570.1 hypothetical protein EA473_16120 [Natrarchaeobius chitinivorans]
MVLEGALDATVSVDGRGGQTVAFAFTVRNAGSEPIELQFSDTAKAEFVVQEEGREVWRFTDGRAFAQVIGSERLAPDETATYDEEWTDPEPGSYTVVAELRAQTEHCEARTDLTVPS